MNLSCYAAEMPQIHVARMMLVLYKLCSQLPVPFLVSKTPIAIHKQVYRML